jgi:hypothetical protein
MGANNMTRILDISDGFTSSSEPTRGELEASKLQSYANDAAYEAANGAPSGGDFYYNTTDDVYRGYNDATTSWESLAYDDLVVHLAGTETVTGDKTFSGSSTFSGTVTNSETVTKDKEQILKHISTPSNPSSGYIKVYPKNDDKLYKLDSAGNEEEIGTGAAGGASGVNYITNGTNPDDTTGWTESADGSFDIARNTTTPLRDDADFSFAKAASDESDEYIAFDFDIDPADVPALMMVTADIDASDANYADDDLKFTLYDLDESEYVAFDGEIKAGKGPYKAFVQTHATSTNYELRVVVNSANTSAYTVYMTNISFSPAVRNYGSPDVYLGELTTTGSWTANTTYTGYYERKGRLLKGMVTVATSGTPTSAGLSIDLPYTMDTTDYNDYTAVGKLTVYDSSGSRYPGFVSYDGNANALVCYVWNELDETDNRTRNIFINQNVPTAFANGDYVTINYEIPISGWSSSVRMSDQVVRSSPTIQKFTSGTGTYTKPAGVQWLKVTMIGGGGGGGGSGPGAGTGTNGSATTFGTGLLSAGGGVGATPGSGGTAGGTGGSATIGAGATGIGIKGNSGDGNTPYNNATQYTNGPLGGAGPFGGRASPTTGVSVNSGSGGAGGYSSAVSIVNGNGGGAGGYIEAVITSVDSTYSYAVGAGGTGGTAGTNGVAGGNGAAGIIIVEEHYLLGDSVGATEVTAFHAARQTSDQTVTAGVSTPVVFNLVREETHSGLVNTSTGVFTANYSGWYKFEYGLQIGMGATAASAIRGAIITSKDSVYRGVSYETDLANSQIYMLDGSARVYLAKGETAYVEVFCISQNVTVGGSSGSTFDQSYFTGERLGGI